MKLLKTIALCAPLFFAIPVFAADDPATQSQNEANAIGIITTIDKAEVSAADLALTKNPPKVIKDYAKFLKSEHTKNLSEADKLAKKLKLAPADTADIQSLQQQAQDDATKLSSLTGNDFNAAYINAMVKGHTDALNTINDKILPNITNTKLKQFVLATKKHVEMHLKKAEAIQKELPSQPEAATTSTNSSFE